MMSSNELVYLDYAATTPVDPQVAATMAALQTADGDFANPSAIHPAGRRSSAHIATAARQLAALLGTEPDRLIWTSGATESNNLAIFGAARARAHRGRHLVTMPTEHKAVTDVFRALEKQGFDVTWLEPDACGLLNVGALEARLPALLLDQFDGFLAAGFVQIGKNDRRSFVRKQLTHRAPDP